MLSLSWLCPGLDDCQKSPFFFDGAIIKFERMKKKKISFFPPKCKLVIS